MTSQAVNIETPILASMVANVSVIDRVLIYLVGCPHVRQKSCISWKRRVSLPDFHQVNFSGSGRLCKESHGWWHDHLTLSWDFKTHLMQPMTCGTRNPSSSAPIKKKLAHLERTSHHGSSTFCSLQQLQLVTFSCRLLPSFPFDFTPLFPEVVTFFLLRSTPLQS